MKLDEYGFRIPTWPLACPPVHSQADILSVTVGNTHLTWTVHGTFEEQFIPGVFWRYILVSFIVVRVLLDFLPLISLLFSIGCSMYPKMTESNQRHLHI